MNVLFLSVSVPPFAESQTIRNAYLLRALAEAGHDVRVVTAECPQGDPTLGEIVPASVRVLRTRRPVYDTARGWIERVPQHRARSLARSGFAVAMGKVGVPDVRFDWTGAATRLARRAVPAGWADVVVSSAGSYTAHLAAARLVRRWNVPWVAEYGDPWAFNPLPPASLPHIRWANHRLERRALARCSTLTVTTEETRRGYEEWLADRPVPIRVLPCGFDDRDFVAEPLAPADGERVVVSYIGTASRQQRSLVPVLDALALLRDRDRATFDRLELRVIGSSPVSFEQHAASLGLANVRFVGPVAYRRSVDEIRDSHLLLLLGNQGQMQVPLKAFMYLGAGRPILYAGQLGDAADPTWELVRRFDATEYATHDAPAIADALQRMVGDLGALTARASARRGDAALRPYTWSAIGSQFADLLASLATERGRGA